MLFYTTADISGNSFGECLIKFIHLAQQVGQVGHERALTAALRSARAWMQQHEIRRTLPESDKRILLVRSVISAAMASAAREGHGAALCLHTRPESDAHVYYYSHHVRILMEKANIGGRYIDIVINAHDKASAVNFLADMYRGHGCIPTTRPLDETSPIKLDNIGLGFLL